VRTKITLSVCDNRITYASYMCVSTRVQARISCQYDGRR